MLNSASSKKIKLLQSVSLITFTLIIFFGIINLILTNLLNIDGLKLNYYLNQTTIIAKENQELQSKLSHIKSLTFVENQAHGLGFFQINQIATVNPSDTMAHLPNQ